MILVPGDGVGDGDAGLDDGVDDADDGGNDDGDLGDDVGDTEGVYDGGSVSSAPVVWRQESVGGGDGGDAMTAVVRGAV